MANNKESNTNQIHLVEETFKEVNLKIDQLLDCSVKDFELLNNSFKQFHALLNKLSNQNLNFLNTLTNNTAAKELQELCEDIEDVVKEIDQALQVHLMQLKEVAYSYHHILLCTNNLKQDLSTLHLLFTNLRFDPQINVDKEKFKAHLNRLNNCLADNEKQIRDKYEQINSAINFADDANKNGLDLHTGIIDKIITHVGYFTDIKDSLTKSHVKFEELEVKKNDSTSEIITNLQFQDILRQKIEHIQEAHQAITTNLYSSNKSSDILDQKELIQIRDITSLQSALLIHANKEYQKAIETIIKRISILKVLQSNYSTLWNNSCKPELTALRNKLQDISQDTSLLKTKTYSFNLFTEKHTELIKSISTSNTILHSLFNESSCFSSEAGKLEKYINTFIDKSSTEEITSLKQLKEEVSKFQNGRKKLAKLTDELSSNKETTINQIKAQLLPIKSVSYQLDRITSTTESFLNVLNEISNEKVDEEGLSAFSIDKVSYYKTFEAEVEKIIKLLDSLLDEMNIDKSEIDPSKLNHLKDMYTMQSERDVHERLIKNNDDNDDKEDSNSDQDEVEFF